MTSRWHAAQERLGRRGAFQVLFGVIYLLYGSSLILEPKTARFGWFGWFGNTISSIVNSPGLAWMWVVCALVGIAVAMLPRSRPDGAGFAALIIPSWLWAALYIVSWVIGLVTDGAFGYAAGWPVAVVWLGATGTLMIVAGWPDPNPNGTTPIDLEDPEQEKP